MRYTAFSFKNFKGINEMRLDLHGDVTTLIGLNESGKTTILEAIFCFSYGAENLDVINPSMASLRDPESWIPISQRANFNDTISITAEVELSSEDANQFVEQMKRQFDFKVDKPPSGLVISEEYAFKNSRMIQNNSKKTWSLILRGTKGKQRKVRSFGSRTAEWQGAVALLKPMLPSIWYFPNFLFELPDRFVLEGLGGDGSSEDRDKNMFYKFTFEQILNSLGYGANLETHVVERLKSSDRADQRSLRSVLLDMSRMVTKTIFEGWNRIFGRPPSAQEVELEADTGNDGNAFLELKIKGPDGYYDLSERSLGFRWFFMFLLLTNYRRGAVLDRPSMFLLDEPASNLHSSAQAELLKSFENLSVTCHLVYTTHSHHLINLKWLDSAYVIKNEALEASSLDDYFGARMAARTSISATRYRQFVVQHPDQTSYFQPVLDLLDYRPSSLEPIPSVVLVEGKTDFYLLRYVVETYRLASSLHLVPGLGAGSLDPLIRLHVGWGKSFVLLLDGDREGRKQKARYEKVFGPLVNQRSLLLPDLIEDQSVLEAENILEQEERLAVIKAVFADGIRPRDKKAFGRAVLELYARGQEVALSDGTLTRFADLVARIERALEEQEAQ